MAVGGGNGAEHHGIELGVAAPVGLEAASQQTAIIGRTHAFPGLFGANVFRPRQAAFGGVAGKAFESTIRVGIVTVCGKAFAAAFLLMHLGDSFITCASLQMGIAGVLYVEGGPAIGPVDVVRNRYRIAAVLQAAVCCQLTP